MKSIPSNNHACKRFVYESILVCFQSYSPHQSCVQHEIINKPDNNLSSEITDSTPADAADVCQLIDEENINLLCIKQVKIIFIKYIFFF